MTDSAVKPFLASRTVWAGIVAILASALGLLDITIGPEDQSALVEIALQAVTLVSGAVAIWGRVRATKRIG